MQEPSSYYFIETHHGPLHVHINYKKESGLPTKIFCNIPPIGTEINGITHLIGILLSKYFEIGGDAQRILKHLQSIKSEHLHRYKGMEIESIPHAISIALRDHLQSWKKEEKVDIKDQLLKKVEDLHENKGRD